MKFKMLVAMVLSGMLAVTSSFAATVPAEDPMGADQDQDIMQLADNDTSATSGLSGALAANNNTSATVSGTGSGVSGSAAGVSADASSATSDNNDLSADTATGDDDY